MPVDKQCAMVLWYHHGYQLLGQRAV